MYFRSVFFVLILLSSPFRETSMSAVFIFNVSLNDDAPLSPIPLAVDWIRIEKSRLLMDAIFVLFLLVFTTQIKMSDCCV